MFKVKQSKKMDAVLVRWWGSRRAAILQYLEDS
jgi:hypothetical protein